MISTPLNLDNNIGMRIRLSTACLSLGILSRLILAYIDKEMFADLILSQGGNKGKCLMYSLMSFVEARECTVIIELARLDNLNFCEVY